MADQKLSQLDPTPSPLDGTELAYVVQGVDSYRTTTQEIADLAAGGSGTVTSVSSANGDLTVANSTTTPALTVVSAPKLTTARNINGVAFDGTANVTVQVPVATGITGLGTNVATALAVNVGSAGAPVVQNGALGTPSSGVATNLTGIPAGQVVGVIPIPNLATGTPDGTKFVRDDGTLAVPSGSAGITSLTGDVTASGPGAAAATVVRINGQSLAALGTGIVKNTTTTGVPSIAVAGDFPTLNQNTTGSAATLTTPRDINGVAFNGSANITVTVPVATGITGLGTGIATALAVNVGSAGAPVLFNGALGTPSSGTLTSATGLPISTGVSGLGSNVATFLATPSSANLAAALTNETGTGVVVFSDSPALTTQVTLDGVLLTPQILQNSQSAAYTMVLSDANKHIYHPTSDTNNRTWTIPANSSVAYPIGTTLTFVADVAGTNIITIAITSDTLVLASSGATGSRTLAVAGIATAIKVTSTRWIISGVGLT